MRSTLKILICVLLINQQKILAQHEVGFKDRISLKLAYSFSITQFGPSPFSSTRPFRRGISSALLNAQYEQPINKNFTASIGLQLAEKGMQQDYTLIIPGIYEQYDNYERRLHYVEMPLTGSYCLKRIKFTLGIALSYLYSHDLRYREHIIKYDRNTGLIKEDDFSEIAIKGLENNYKKWDLGGIIGVSYRLINDLDIEAQAQKQLIYANNIYPNSKDVAYSLTLSVGLRYRFL
jgi:hypothetical protein